MIYCSIDLMKGKAVQLVQGKAENKKVEVADLIGLAAKFAQIGPINLIDLDAALEQGDHRSLILELVKQFSMHVGGGIRTLERAQEYVDAGAKKIILGSKALDIPFLQQLVETVPREKILLALDAFQDDIVIRGWREKTHLRPEELLPLLEPYCSGFLYTQVEREGLMKGPDFERLRKLRRLTHHPLIAAGGISSLEEIAALQKEGIDSVLGMALYTGKIPFHQLLPTFR
jgi:phosphoribosylformimino-5-aminoimidazole carboxamide ribotide isomerase